ncbi:type 2 periplasmic-binding domain-containing protein [Pleomorphovibrio marinus]|uniref:ABC transporter substrate-binding protein n=1 Tax=Pleomorphovibrio marinus TaxID=2164132 RepID=UPI000E0C3C46|nr:ABC transporter substrate-binding protein [Pleomorphovibrio marinus]
MEKIRIIGVPEHYNYPWRKWVEAQSFVEDEIILDWRDEPKGSGAMNRAIREGEADLAIILTESFIKDKVEGSSGKIIGFHVRSPLIWGIHVPANSSIEEIHQLKNIPFLVSRMGSGSHLMAFLLAKREAWPGDSLEFEVIGDLKGAIQAFKKATPKAFLWEKYTTQPLVDKGLFRRVGEIPTPWPCFVMVASERALHEHPEVLRRIRDGLYAFNTALGKEAASTKEAIQEFYGLNASDVAEWFSQTTWAASSVVNKKDLEKTMDVLSELKLIKQKIAPEELVDSRFVKWE